MPQGPPEPPSTIILGSFAGIRNNIAAERLKQDDLASAVNVDIDDAGQLRRRRGYTKRIAEPCHSLTTIGGATLVVKSGVLGRVYSDFSFAPIVEVGSRPLCYAQVADTTFFSGPSISGKIVGGALAPWGSAIEDRWVSPVTRPTETLGQVGGRLLGGAPNATAMESYKGRLYLANGRTVWATELYLYDLVDRTRNFLQFEDDVTMIASVSDGLYVGTTGRLLFLQGTFSKGLAITEVLTEGVIPGTQVRVPYSKALPQARTAPLPEGYGPMFMTTAGVVVGADGGQAYNLTQDRVVFPGAGAGAATYREDRGLNSYLASIDSGGSPAANARIGDYVAVEIRRAVDGPLGSTIVGQLPDVLQLLDNLDAQIKPGAITALTGTAAFVDMLTAQLHKNVVVSDTVRFADVYPGAGAITFDPIVYKSGDNYTYTARRSVNISNSETRTVTLAGSTNYPPGALASDFGGAFPSISITFPAGSPTTTFVVNSPNAQPE